MSDIPEIWLAAEEVRSNFIKTVMLLLSMVGVIVLLSWLLGTLINNPVIGWKIGFLACFVVIPIELMCAKFMITSLSGCYQINPEVPKELEVLRIVENISISAGLQKTPEVYVMETDIPNAFAAGWNEDSAYIVVTDGLLARLNRQELEGVIAHEIAHVIHRDIMITNMAISLNTAIFLLSICVRIASLIVAVKSRNIFALLLFFIIQPTTFIISCLLFAGISQKREFAADAMAVRLCSYNQGLISALSKLSRQESYSDDQIDELGGKHMEALYFHYPSDSIFSTHPPIEERIERLKHTY